MTRLTRRDRAAMVLALECARVSAADALDVLRHGDAASLVLMHAGQPRMKWFGPLGTPECRAWLREHAIYRARLALVLRAILRADAGDCGPTVLASDRSSPPMCTTCWEPVTDEDEICTQPGCDGAAASWSYPAMPSRRIDALWQSAPATGTATRPAGLRRRA